MNFFQRLRFSLKKRFDSISNETLKKNLLQALPFWVGSLLTGLAAVLYAKMFSWAEHGLLWLVEWKGWIIFITAPVFFFLAWWLTRRFGPASRGSGIPQVMAAIELSNPQEHHKVDRLLSLKIAAVKVFSSMLMVMGGGAVGREGPTIQIAGSIFRWINKLVPYNWPRVSKKNMLVTGAAAGLAAAFNTPLGGVVFAMEELSKMHIRYFRTAIFTAVIIAGLAAQALLGPYLYLGYPNVEGLNWYVLLVVVLVGLISGLGGSSMATIILKIFKTKKRWNTRKHLWYLLACALLMASFSFFFTPLSLGSGKEIMEHALFSNDKQLPWYLPVLRFVGPIASFTVGGAGGVFAPGLTVGATVGAVFAHWFSFVDGNANILILAGMVGFLTGITRSPFTSAILVLEMTDRHNVIFHLMLAGMVANIVSMVIDKTSFYDHLKETFLEETRQDFSVSNLNAKEEAMEEILDEEAEVVERPKVTTA